MKNLKVNIDKVKDQISGEVTDLVFEDRDEFSWYMRFEIKGVKTSLLVRHKDIKRLVKSI